MEETSYASQQHSSLLSLELSALQGLPMWVVWLSALGVWLLWAVWLDVRPCPGQRLQPLVGRLSSWGSWLWNPSGPSTSSGSQMGRARFWGGRLWSKVSRASVSLLVGWTSSWHSLLQLLRCPEASTGLKVGGAGSRGGWLRGSTHFRAGANLLVVGLGPRSPGACASLLVYWLGPDKSGCGAVVVPGLVSICWWVKPGPRASAGHRWVEPGPGFSGYRNQVSQSQYQTTGEQSQSQGAPRAGTASLVGRAGQQDLWLQCPECAEAEKTVLIIILASIYQLLSTSQHASKILQAWVHVMLAITLYSSLLSIGRETKAQVTYLKITELEITQHSSQDWTQVVLVRVLRSPSIPPIHTLQVYLWVARKVDSVLI